MIMRNQGMINGKPWLQKWGTQGSENQNTGMRNEKPENEK